MTLEQAHAALYTELQCGLAAVLARTEREAPTEALEKLAAHLLNEIVIDVLCLSDDDARLVSGNATLVAVALGHSWDKVKAAYEGDTFYIDLDLSKRFKRLLEDN